MVQDLNNSFSFAYINTKQNERNIVMRYRDNSMILLGENSLIKQQLKNYFVLNKYRLVDGSKRKKESPIPIFIMPHDAVDMDNYLEIAIRSLDESTAFKLLFLISVDSSLQEKKQSEWQDKLQAAADTVIEIRMDVIDKANDYTYIEETVTNLGKSIEHYLLHPPESDYAMIDISAPKEKSIVGVVGLGYVGLAVAAGFSDTYEVIGFDIDEEKIASLKNNKDPQKQVSNATLQKAGIQFVADPYHLKKCDYLFVAVPTPLTSANKPDLTFLKSASRTIGENITPGTVVVYESTVYPGTTEQVCIPILEEKSGLTAGTDFYVGYSPERINPGDKEHTFKTIPKVIAGQNECAAEKVHDVYRHALQAEIYKAPSIKVAEAAKIVENTQRDLNIAFMNELSMMFHAMDIDTNEVLEAAKTKWNFIPFSPGLVGGHCISVDPYYLIYKSLASGYSPKLISAAREVNDGMPEYVVQSLLQLLAAKQLNLRQIRIAVLGISFKENIPDLRNSKALEIVQKLKQLGFDVQVCDPYVSPAQLKNNSFELTRWENIKKSDVVIVAVPHHQFKKRNKQEWQALFKDDKAIVMDLKNVLPGDTFKKDMTIWKL